MSAVYTEEWRKWWLPENGTKVTYYQFMAKDNVPFHSVMFPACLFATERNYTFVDHIMATGLFFFIIIYKSFLNRWLLFINRICMHIFILFLISFSVI